MAPMYCPDCGEVYYEDLICPECEEPLVSYLGTGEDALEYAYIHMDEEPLAGLTEEQVMEIYAEDYLYRDANY